ncbi:TonB-dependent receptor [Stutzerimonas stutzeri]|uniref:TonB-dependent receptor n=1 Tax=Stutzerimonas stutzeri TaxID=316 RepID=W8R687_STUST|nr:TonB-dependent siderophore receptor [Stutzerimonas stutzeri]AHL73817.1 TonB-dependent receptor [Stutzerimonas stutzeri]MCQ4328667.1 TonB-dependent siderophore receptor [Stutzerimonas stutzeri]
MDRTLHPSRFGQRAFPLLLAGLLAPFPLSALAQSVAPQNEPVELESITVEGNRLYDMPSSEQSGGYTVPAATVGTKTPAELRDIPQSISSYTSDYIRDRQFVNLDDLAKYSTGLRTLTNDSGRSSIYARGYEYDEFNIDGLPAPMASIHGTVPSLSPFDRVEVMRGPSGLFNSTSEMGGIVNMVRKRPTSEFQGSVTGRYGSWDTTYLETDLSGPLDEQGRVRGRIVASRADSNGEVDYNENTSESFYGALDIDLTDATVMSFGLIHQTKDIAPHNGYPTDANGNLLDWSHSTYLGADWNDFDGRTTDAIAELTHRFDNGGYGRIAVRGSQRDTNYLYAYSGGAVAANGDTRMVATGRDFQQDTYAVDASYSQPFELLGQVSEFVVGTDFKRYDSDYRNGSATLGTVNIYNYTPSLYAEPDLVYSSKVTSDDQEAGLYGKLTFRPVERLALIGGMRLSWYEGESSTTNLVNGARTSDDQKQNGHVTPYGGVVYDLDSNHSLYASYSQVFKPQSDTDANGQLIDPREGEQYELGIKGSYFGGDLNARITAFQLTDENRATSALDSFGVPISGVYEATGKARIRGGEFEVSGYLTPEWEVMAGYTYMKTEDLSGDANTLFMLMPRHQASLWSKYTLPSGTLRGLGLGAGVTTMSDFYLERSGTRVSAPGYAVVDAKLSYPVTEQLTATLDVNNLFDRDYVSRVGSVATFNFQGPSRSVALGARYEF